VFAGNFVGPSSRQGNLFRFMPIHLHR